MGPTPVILSHCLPDGYPTGNREPSFKSQVGPGTEPILKLQDSESYRNRGFWNRSNTNTHAPIDRSCLVPSFKKCIFLLSSCFCVKEVKKIFFLGIYTTFLKIRIINVILCAQYEIIYLFCRCILVSSAPTLIANLTNLKLI